MLVEPYSNDSLFKDGLSTIDVDGERFRHAVNSTGNPNGLSIVDIGSYPGTAYEYFGKENRYTACGLINGAFAEKLRANKIAFENIDIQVNSTSTLLPHADLILFQEILEHIRMPKKGLLEIYKKMKPGSKLYITTNNIYYYGYIIKLILGRPILGTIESEDSIYPQHHRYYSIEEVKQFFESLSAQILIARRINFLPPIYCYKNTYLAILKKALAFLLPQIYSTHIELLIQKPNQ